MEFFLDRLVNYKLTVSDKTGKSISKEVKDDDANPLLGLEIPTKTDASIVGLSGQLTITGGSDKSGVPMRPDVHGQARKYVLLSKGVGLQDTEKGLRKRKLVRGNTISDEIYQLNCKFDGELKAEEAYVEAQEEAPKKEEKKEAPKKEEKKEAPKKEENKKSPKKE